MTASPERKTPVGDLLPFACRTCGAAPKLSIEETQKLGRAQRRGIVLPRFTCGRCRAAEIVERRKAAAEAAQQRRRAELDHIRENAPAVLGCCGVPKRWQAARFTNCPDLPNELLQALAEWTQNPRGIVFLWAATPGAGKTWLAVAAMWRVLEAGQYQPSDCAYVGQVAYLDRLKASYARPGGPVAEPDPASVEFLVLDDVGTSYDTGWAKAEMATLISRRYGDDRPTIITSNLNLDDLADRLGRRVASRIAHGDGNNILHVPEVELRRLGCVSGLAGDHT